MITTVVSYHATDNVASVTDHCNINNHVAANAFDEYRYDTENDVDVDLLLMMLLTITLIIMLLRF